MLPHRRRDFAAGNHFSFSHPPRAADAMGEYNAWAERIKGANHGYFARSPDPNPGAWARRPDQIRRAAALPPPPTTELGGGDPIRSAADAEEQGFRWAAKESYDSDTPSPPLWKSPPVARSAGSSPIRSVYRDDGDDDDDRGRYPNQRAHAIERYRQEMMEMVRGLPEAAYELSLRDIVESPFPRIARIEGQRSTDEAESPKEKSEKGASRSEKETKKEKNKKKKKKVRRISRSESLDTGGLLIKMFMPLSVGGRRKSFGASSAGTGAKVSPKPAAATAAAAAAAAAGEGNNKGEEWWNKNEFSEAESSRTSSTNSSSSSGSSKSGSRSRGRRMSSCYSFFRSSKSRSRRS